MPKQKKKQNKKEEPKKIDASLKTKPKTQEQKKPQKETEVAVVIVKEEALKLKNAIFPSQFSFDSETSNFNPEDALMQQTFRSENAKLEQAIEEEAPSTIPPTNDFYSSNKGSVVYNSKTDAYTPTRETDAQKMDLGGYQVSNKSNYDLDQREKESQGNTFYNEKDTYPEDRVGEIRVNNFKNNLESAATQKKKNPFNPQTYS